MIVSAHRPPFTKMGGGHFPVLVVAGPAGSGKTTLAAALSHHLDGVFIEADDHHSAAAKAQMANGIPLTEADRIPWLDRCAQQVNAKLQHGRPVVMACSALSERSRNQLRELIAADVLLLMLHTPERELHRRIHSRAEHFMPAGLTASQLSAWEPISPRESGIRISGTLPTAQQVSQVLALLQNGSK